MLKKYLKQVPTLVVTALSVFATWPALFPDGVSGPAKGTSKPPKTAGHPASSPAGPGRSPFQSDRRPAPTATATPTALKAVAPSAAATRTGGLAGPPGKDDAILAGMRLGGTFVDGLEQLAVIDGKVYARGDRLKRPDGSPLPYTLAEVRKDRAVIRLGGRDVILAFSNTPRSASPSPGPGRPGSPNPAGSTARTETSAQVKKPPATRARDDFPGAKGLILGLLSRLGGPAMGSGGGPGPGPPGIGIDAGSISDGLDALMGKSDDLGRAGSPTPGSSVVGRETTP